MKAYPHYKDSEYDWIGNIPEHWKMVQLKFVAPRKTEQTEDVKGFGFQVALENIESKTGKIISSGSFEGLGNIFRKDDVLFNKLRPYLCKVVIAPNDGVAVSELLVLRPREDIDKRFLFYRLLESKFISVVDGSTYGAKMPRANWDFIGNLKIPTPPLPEQQAIADFLDRKTAQIDTLIEKKQRQIELLQEQRTALINHAVTKGLNPNAKMKDSGVEWLGEIPSHWEVKRLKYLASITTGERDTVDRIEDGKFPFFVRSQTVERINSFSFDGEAVLTAGDGVGVAKVFHYINGKFDFHQRVYKFSDFIDIQGKFFFYYIKSLLGFEVLKLSAKSTVDSLRLPMFQNFPMVLPSKEEQSQIIEFIETKENQIDTTIQELTSIISLLQEYRTALISEAVTGKIDVRTAE